MVTFPNPGGCVTTKVDERINDLEKQVKQLLELSQKLQLHIEALEKKNLTYRKKAVCKF